MQKESSTGLRQLLDHTEKHVRALKKLGEPTDQWGTILVYLTTAKFDNTTKQTLKLDKSKGAKLSSSDTSHKSSNANKKAIAAVTAEAKSDKCLACNQGNHRLYHCPSFLNLAPPARSKEDEGTEHGSGSQNSTVKSQAFTESQATSVVHHAVRLNERGLLATAIIKIQDKRGDFQEARAFLDPGSQSNFMTKDLCERLGLPQRRNHMHIRGIDNVQTTALTETHATIQSKFNAFKVGLHFSILPEITVNLPLSEINKNHLQIPETITLVDPSFHIPGQRSCNFSPRAERRKIKLGKNQPIAQKTKLGWIIAGPISFKGYNESSIVSVSSISAVITIKTQLERFWQIEECNVQLEASENFANRNLIKHIDATQLVVSKFDYHYASVDRLGHSRDIAIKRLRHMERKFTKSPEIKQQYKIFMQEYEELNHMTEISNQEDSQTSLYLPHHAVVKPDSVTTKLRVVFDASCPTSSGVSLNNILHTGPTIQQDLLSIILRFRQHRFVITADIKQMYRQILVQDDQRDLQRIVWRPDTSEPIRDYRLNTITYGMASSPFLAI
ncbi:PREDICTED: uncharacterized protein LOC108777262 [Cyphomyrmex costatus]|uniref:uncharacterized protein LOC108777262 n=1 Tax=Cyphomyrmex costatus TaxID=456900 RepID=UPI00085229AF|nr:PREDICTED: uncharacterized protein LOC108777262 [Cyphomyrmex costatus]